MGIEQDILYVRRKYFISPHKEDHEIPDDVQACEYLVNDVLPAPNQEIAKKHRLWTDGNTPTVKILLILVGLFFMLDMVYIVSEWSSTHRVNYGFLNNPSNNPSTVSWLMYAGMTLIFPVISTLLCFTRRTKKHKLIEKLIPKLFVCTVLHTIFCFVVFSLFFNTNAYFGYGMVRSTWDRLSSSDFLTMLGFTAVSLIAMAVLFFYSKMSKHYRLNYHWRT